VTVKSHGRHRAPGRYNPLSELSIIATRAASPAIKGSAVLAASGGLVAAFAIPASAVGDSDAVAAVATADGGTSAAISDRATQVAASRAAVRPALTAPAVAAPVAVPSFGALSYTAVEKPPPPPPPPPPPAPEPSPAQAPAATPAASNGTGSSAGSSSSRSSGSSSSAPAPAPAPTNDAPSRVSSGGVIGVAASLTGIPYKWGGTTPAGFDCSGFTQYVFAQVGISLGRTTHAQYAQTRAVSNPQPGDLVFYGGSSPWHVGIYAGNGMMYDSPRAGKSTSLRPLFSGSPEIRRVG
jgi:peptidoglycan DL-endopeptidase CwlO